MAWIIKLNYHYKLVLWGPRFEEGIVELLALVLGYHVPDEGIHLKRRGEETKDSKSISSSRYKNYAIFATPNAYFIILPHHFTTSHLSDVL